MKALKKKPREPGYDGAVEIADPLQISTVRKGKERFIRCRPGTFEWRYARRNADMTLFHAGSHYAILWERAGTASNSSPDLGAIRGSGWKGLPNGNAVAMDELKHAFRAIGKASSSRLTSYCVEGKTTSELASQYGIPDRDMAAVLHQDLRACALHFRYL